MFMRSWTGLAALPRRSRRLIAFALLILIATLPASATGSLAQETGGGISVSFGPDEIWNATPLVEQLHACGQPTVTCVTNVMQTNSATPAAMAFYRLTGWFLTDLQGGDPVQLGTVLNPWRANENSQPVLLGGSPAVVTPEVEVATLTAGSWSSDSTYAALKAAHPQILFWGSGPQLEIVSSSPSGGQRFIFNYRMLDGCHACATIAVAQVAFDFAPDGTYQSMQQLSLTPSP